jgi:hypothetical protein
VVGIRNNSRCEYARYCWSGFPDFPVYRTVSAKRNVSEIYDVVCTDMKPVTTFEVPVPVDHGWEAVCSGRNSLHICQFSVGLSSTAGQGFSRYHDSPRVLVHEWWSLCLPALGHALSEYPQHLIARRIWMWMYAFCRVFLYCRVWKKGHNLLVSVK